MPALTTHEQIKDRAYALWEADGRPEGRDKHYWDSAERQLSEELGVDISAEQAEIDRPPLVPGFVGRPAPAPSNPRRAWTRPPRSN